MNVPGFRIAISAAVLLSWSTPSWSAEPNWPEQLTLGTASPGGTYEVFGNGLAKILTRTLNLPVVSLATDGPAQNIEMLETGEAKIGFVTIGIALQAWNGTGIWAGKKPARSMRAIFPMYDTPFQFLVFRESGPRSVAEMVGKRVGVGPRGGTSAAYFPEFFRKLNVSVNFVFGEWAELAAQVHRRELDVLAAGAGVLVPSFLELEARDKVRYIAFSQGQLAELRLAMPELSPSRIPAGMYPSLRRNYETVGLYNFAVAHAEVRAVFENQDEMIEAHPAAAETVHSNLDR